MMLPLFRDKVQVIRVLLSVEQETPPETVELFRCCVGQTFRIDGFGEYGHLELNVSDDGSQAADYSRHTILIEPEFVELNYD
jgi:hypothetical protein